MFPNNVLKVQFFAVLYNFVGADPCVRPPNSRFVCFAWRIRVSAPTNSRFVCFVGADLCVRPHTRVRSPVFGWLFLHRAHTRVRPYIYSITIFCVFTSSPLIRRMTYTPLVISSVETRFITSP